MSPIGLGTSRSTFIQERGIAKIWLLLVGINQYQDQGLACLRYSAVDCQELAAALADATQIFQQKEVTAYHDFTAEPPTLTNVRASLNRITTAAEVQDTILIYFSGHGILEPSTQQAFLSLADTEIDDLFQTGLSLQEILHLLGNSKAQNQLLWLDACHSGGITLTRGNAAKKEPLLSSTPEIVELLQQRAKKSKGFYALLSCDNEQQSWEFPELGHGVFTYYLMRGLRGEAADSQGLIEVDSLYRYVYRQTVRYIEQINQQLRLINQHKRARGDTQLYSEYPVQTRKRIVEGVGELIVGLKPAETESFCLRKALVVEGVNICKTTLDLSKLLGELADLN
jgi:uncharacterized caspase-like protein